MSQNTPIRVRMAPSPTGNLHVGTAQSALYNYLFAKKHNGEFHVRIEDTDTERSTKEFENNILEGFKWLGLDLDGPVTRSSDNKDKYKRYLEKLLNSGKAFWCDHSREELDTEQKKQTEAKEAPRHVCSHKKDKLSSGQVIRLAVDHDSDREIEFNDLVRGPVKFKQSLLGDFSIARNLDSALYHFAVVIDDVELGTTHIIRGEDHLSNTPKHILIYEALGQKIPNFVHLPLLLGTDRSKLSKRNGQTSIDDYKKDYLPEALLNFLGVISHTFSKEILSKEEMVEEFDLAKVHKSGAVFDVKKLNWINAQHVRKLTPDRLRGVTGISEIPDSAVPLITERLERLSEAREYSYLWSEPKYDKELLCWKDSSIDRVKEVLREIITIINNYNFENGKEGLRFALDELSKKAAGPDSKVSGGDRGLVYWPLRVALSGKQKSPDPVDIAFVIGKEKTIERVGVAIIK